MTSRPSSHVLTIVLAVLLAATAPVGAAGDWLDAYRDPAARLIGEALSDRFAWQRLALLTDTIGHRLSGSPSLDRAITWAVEEMKKDGLENVHAEPVLVPKWVRGRESAELVEPAPHALAMLGLGDSIGTPAGGLQAEVLVVKSIEELDLRSQQAKGRIVLFNQPFTNYEDSRPLRSFGPSRAARHGAVAALVRSIGPAGLRLPHTGALQYSTDAARIPAAAIATEDADQLQRMADRGQRIVARLQMEAHFEADAPSANVVGELRGRDLPDEFVVVGCHLDSWDVGAGASDDGGGCIATWDALRMMKKLGLRPRRTVRVVLWTNEENGTRGAVAYRDAHKAELRNHVLMIESDSGVFRPLGFGFSGNNRARETVQRIAATLLRGIGADAIGPVGGGADIDPAVQEGRIAAMSLEVDDSQYYRIHHTAADTVDKIDPMDLAKCSAAVAVMAYVVADMPQRLPH